MRKINFNWITAGYLVLLGLILLSTTSRQPDRPKQMIIERFEDYNSMKDRTEFLFKKGWLVKDMESFHNLSNSYSDYIVIYEK